MNILNDIKVLAPRVIKNADKIVEGVKTNIQKKTNNLDEDKVAIIDERKSICESCPFNSRLAQYRNGEYEQLIRETEKNNGIIVDESINLAYKTSRPDLHCSLCGCNIEYKTSCLSCNCGIETFNENYEADLPLKWTAVTTN